MANGVVTIPLPGEGRPLTICRPRTVIGNQPPSNSSPARKNASFTRPLRACLAASRLRTIRWSCMAPAGPASRSLTPGLGGHLEVEFSPESYRLYHGGRFRPEEMADAFETQAVEDFRARYRGVGLAVFEDVGELAYKPAAQEELIRTLDAVIQRGGQVVATASSHAAGDCRFSARTNRAAYRPDCACSWPCLDPTHG